MEIYQPKRFLSILAFVTFMLVACSELLATDPCLDPCYTRDADGDCTILCGGDPNKVCCDEAEVCYDIATEECCGDTVVETCDPDLCEVCNEILSRCEDECRLTACGECNAGECEDIDSWCRQGDCDVCSGGECVDDVSECNNDTACELCVNSNCTPGCEDPCHECVAWSGDYMDCDYACVTGQECCGDDCITECQTSECKECDGDGDCEYYCTTHPDLFCKASDGTCYACDDTIDGACSVSDEDMDFDANNCVSNLFTNGQCSGGVGGHIAAWDQLSSTDDNVVGPGEDVAGCGLVDHVSCMNVPTSTIGHFDCVPDPASRTTDNRGTHKECP